MRLIVAKIGNNETVSFAVNELCRLIKEMDSTVIMDVRKYLAFDESVEDAIWVGTGFVEKNEKDTIFINVNESVGFIGGSNERSVLISVYRFMKEMGCCYLYPGKEGEVIPKKTLTYSDLTVRIKETASYSHRGICIEGTLGYEHAYNIIDWLPKVGMSEYFFQFFTPSAFFNNYYKRFSDTILKDSEIDALVLMLDEEIKKRSLKYHTVGHGWTCAPFGIGASGWDKYEGEPPENVKNLLAEIDGKRTFFEDIPLNTNLCYSNSLVREKMADSVVEYCKNNQHKDYIHIYLADGANNHCECEKCKEKTPADYYVMILNEVDEKLTKMGIETKIVSDFYNDLMWAPEKEKISHPERFVMDFAPISRSYSVSYADIDFNEEVEIEPYIRNKNKMSYSLLKVVKMFDKWREEQSLKNCFLFDYHLMWDHHYDPGYYDVAKILQKDMANLDKIGVDGMMSCQLQRIAFPTNLPMYCMAKTLWNKEETFEDIVKEYYTVAFGEYAKDVENYLSTLSKLFAPEVLRGEKDFEAEEMIGRYKKAKETVEVFKENYINKLAETSKRWEYLLYHAEMVKMYADIYIAKFNQNDEECKAKIELLNEYVENTREFTDIVLDNVFLRGDVYNNLYGWRKTI